MKTSIRITLVAWLCQATIFVPGLARADGLLLLDNPANIGDETGAYAVAEGFQSSDSVPIRQFITDWQGAYTPRSGNNIGIMTARAEAGVQWNGFRLGALYRAQALVETNRDTTDLVRQYNTNSGYDNGRSYAIDYKLAGFAARGLRLSKSLHFDAGNDWQLHGGLAGALLTGTQLKMESASGQAVALNAKDFSADTVLNSRNSALDTSDSSLFNSFVQPQSFGGEGYSLDAGLVMRRSDGLQVEVAVNDLAGQMDWKGVPQRVTNYNTATKSYDSAGYVHFNPSATAVNNYTRFTQVLDPKVWMAVSYPVGRFEIQVGTSYITDIWLPEANLAFPLSEKWRVKTGYDLRFGSVSLTLQHPWFEFSIRTDNPDLAQAKAYGMRLAFTVPI